MGPNSTLDQTTISQELNTVRAIIADIKNHVLEQGVQPVNGMGQLPKASQKVINIREEVRAISKELEEVLNAVIAL